MFKRRLLSVVLSLALVSLLAIPCFSGCGGETAPENVFEGMYAYADFETPDTCGSCHQDIYSDWSASLMGTNYVKYWKQVEYFQLAYAQSQQVEQVSEVASGCIQCHAPLAFLSGDIPPLPAADGTRANESVSCEICHSLTGSSEEDPFNFSAIMNLGNTKYGPRDDSVSTFHETQFSEFIGSPQHCALCHDEQSPYGAWVKETYREWSEGMFPDKEITCIKCHMGSTSGTAAIDGKERDDIAQHTFMAVHTPERLEDDIEIFASVDSAQALPGDTIDVSVDIRSVMCGHYFPSGSTEERMLWLEVWAVDSDNNRYHIPVNAKGFEGEEYTIADSTATAYSDIGIIMGIDGFKGLSRDGDVPDGARIFRRPFFNPVGEMTILQWYTAENTLVDYRFAPRETKTETYTWEIPDDIAGDSVAIELTSYYSLVPSSIGEFLGLDEYYYTAYITGSDSLTVDLSPQTTTPPATTSKTFGELAVRGWNIYQGCEFCHSIGRATASSYENAQKLLNKILTMPAGGLQGSWEVLGYFLVEYGWVSAEDIFDPEALSGILLPYN